MWKLIWFVTISSCEKHHQIDHLMNFTWTSNDPWVKSWDKLKGLNLTVHQSRIANKRINFSTLKTSCFTIAILTQMTLEYYVPRNWIFKVVYKKWCCLNSFKWFLFWQFLFCMIGVWQLIYCISIYTCKSWYCQYQ